MNKEWLETVVKRHDRELSIARVVSVQCEPAVPKGENYSSLILRARVKVILGSGRETKRAFIIKKLMGTEGQNKIIEDFSVFKVETKLFSEVLPLMERLMDEYNDGNERLWSDLIGYNPYDTIIFEDLTAQNFRVANRKECLDLRHGLLVIKNLARFHAMSRVLLQKGLLRNDDLKPMYLASETTVSRRLVEGGLKQVSQVMASSWPPEWKETADRIANDVDGACARLIELAKVNDDTFMVLNHGDCWICNIMFKYSPLDESLPIAMRFVDFQMSNYNSYSWDLVYFIYSSIKAEERRNNYDLILSTYQESLEKTLKFYGYKQWIPTIQDVKMEIDRLDYFSFIVLATILPATSANSMDPFDLEKMCDEDNFSTAYNPDIFMEEKYREAVGQELKSFIEQGII
ncbi:uncharacterized protein [Rhodnius prolixus]|uniref:CHK kinase-like domain-containing protein n=1 Tax=Rhodnius prolixus TaxID=13249 RepID=T1HCW8_RHOPR